MGIEQRSDLGVERLVFCFEGTEKRGPFYRRKAEGFFEVGFGLMLAIQRVYLQKNDIQRHHFAGH